MNNKNKKKNATSPEQAKKSLILVKAHSDVTWHILKPHQKPATCNMETWLILIRSRS